MNNGKEDLDGCAEGDIHDRDVGRFGTKKIFNPKPLFSPWAS